MTKRISCIMADYTQQDDGTMDCVWLADLSVKRGCEYCMKYLEFKTMVNEEGWKSAGQAVHANHPDWPGEWVSVWTYKDSEEELVGYECQDELFKSLHDIEAAGWELIYNYCPSGKEIYRKEEEELAKTFYTKCGREFKKSTEASVTGYKMEQTDNECANCPFQLDIKEGYPGVHKHYECRAGSLPPNQIDDWRGSVDDKNSLHIRSLHNDFLESVLEYCKSQTDLGAGYTQDLEDCRRVISVSCSSNKKGMAAKKALIEKFFNGNGKEEVHEVTAKDKIDKMWATFVKCEACKHIIDEGESVEYCKCAKKRGHVKRKQTACDKFESLEQKEVEEVKAFYEVKEDCTTCTFGSETVEGMGVVTCSEFPKNGQFKAIYDCPNYTPDVLKSCENDEIESFDQEDDKETDPNACPHGKLSCDCRCIGFGGECQVIRRKDMDRYYFVKEMEKHNIDCDTFRDLAAAIIAEKKPGINVNDSQKNVIKTPDSVNEIAEINIKTSEISTFDYSTVDESTAEFLHNKANKVTELRVKSVIEIGKELKEVHERLSNHYQGSFGKWCESIGFSRDTGNNYIRAFTYVTENFGNLTDAEYIQPSLLFAVSKPSAPKELQEQVLAGDITTHKQWKEKESEWKDKLDQSRVQQDTLRTEKQQASIKALDAERRASKLENEAEDLRHQLMELQEQNNEHQETELISNLKNQIIKLETQLKDKPIETSAVKIVEKVPEKNAIETVHRMYGLLLASKLISKQDIQIVCDTATYEKKMAICEFLENLRDMAPGYISMLYGDVPTRKCEECEFCSWDGLKEVDEEKGLILCTRTVSGEPQLISNDSPCQLFKER